MEQQFLPISKLKANTGQIPGLPKNPRVIRDERLEKVVQSIKDDPEMLELRELIVYPYEGNYVVIAGNMRLRAIIDLGYKECPVKVLPVDTPVEKLKAYTIKDNVPYGDNDWSVLSEEWDTEQLSEWGLDVPNWSKGIIENEMTENDLDLDEEFDPIGNSSGLQRVVFIFDGKEEAESYLNKLNVPFVKRNMAWQVNLSTQSIL